MLFGVEHRSVDAISELGYVNGLLPLGVSVVRDCICLSPGQSAGGLELPGTGSTIGNESQRSVSRLSYHASGPPPDVAENGDNMTLRRIYNKGSISPTTQEELTLVGKSVGKSAGFAT